MDVISILIPTYNAEKYVEQLFSGLYQQVLKTDQKIEVIVVDSNSCDNTIKTIRNKFPSVIIEVIPNEKFDHGGTRNYLVSLATGKYLLFMSQDAFPYDQYLIQNLLKPLMNNKQNMISYARQIPKDDANPLEVFARSYNYPPKTIIKSKRDIGTLGIKTFFNSNVCCMYKREVFEKYGGFPEKVILSEDIILATKVIMGNECVSYTANAVVYHSHNYNFNQQFKRYFDIGVAFNSMTKFMDYPSNEKEGFKMIREQILYLAKNNKKYIFLAILENMIKFISYNLGKRNNLIPLKIKKRLSAYMK